MEIRHVNGLELRRAFLGADELGAADAYWKEVLASGRPSANPVFRSYIEGFSLALMEQAPWARSLLVVALGSRGRILRFEREGGAVAVPFPPNYGGSPVSREDVRAHLAEELGQGCRLEAADTVPLKLAAVWAGLARYGRNGICYAPGMGTSFRLMAFWTDAPAESLRGGLSDDSAAARPNGPVSRESLFLERCAGCSACVRACPTGAIPDDYGCVDAARCVSLYNEVEGGFPDWLPRSAHNSAIGCMTCQRCCPEAGADEFSAVVHFSAAELDALLAGARGPEADAAIARAVGSDKEDVVDSYRPVLSRNLRAFLDARAMA